VFADLTSGDADADAGILCLAVALGGVLAFCLREQQGEHRIRIQNPNLSNLGTLIAGVIVAGVASDLMVDQIGLLLFPGRLNADAVVGRGDLSADGAFVLYRGAIRFEGISTAVRIGNGVAQQTGKVDLTGTGIGHRITGVQSIRCLIQSGEGIQVLLLGGGDGGGVHR